MRGIKRFRLIIPLLLIAAWFAVAAIGGPAFGAISQVTTNDQAAFLPSSAESTKVQNLLQKFNSSQTLPAVVVVERSSGFARADFQKFTSLSNRLQSVPGVEGQLAGPIPSKDGKAVEFIANVSTKSELKTVVDDMRIAARSNIPKGATVYVTGPAGLGADLTEAFGGVDSILLIVALAAVFIILLIVYRSLILPILVLINAIFALSAAILAVYLLAKHGVIELNGQSQGILSILVIGASTDYSLLLVSRYREALGQLQSKWEAIAVGVKHSFEPILASAATVILALLCLLFSDLNSNRSLGPVAATGIVFAFLASLSFLPAVLVLLGRVVFWPTKVRPSGIAAAVTIHSGREELTGIWKRVGAAVTSRPRRVWTVVTLVLIASSLGLLQLRASGVPQTDLILSQSNAVEGQKVVARHFAAGSGTPVIVAVPQKSVDSAAKALRGSSEFADVTVFTMTGQNGSLSNAQPVDGMVLLSATLRTDPYSTAAKDAVIAVRQQLSQQVSGGLVGGTTALAVDTNATAVQDLEKIVPIVLAVILVVLMLLFRALIAPVVLILTVVLSYGATLGLSALVFNHLLHFPGADPAVPLFGFIFLVALGVDYNIFLISRTREESFRYGTRAAILHSLGKTGGVITSAGIVLAATFAALGIIPILFLVQIAFIVSFGVLLDTFIVRSLLVPAVFTELGPEVWWPSKKLTK